MQTALDRVCVLVAQQELHRVWGRFDHQRPSEGMSQLLLVVGLGVLAAMTLLVWAIVERRPSRHFVSNSNAQLFREFCQAHGLNFASRRLLKRLARKRGVATPVLLFLEPQHFDTSTLPDELRPFATDVQRLRTQLFGPTTGACG
jgi:hypothetical protein